MFIKFLQFSDQLTIIENNPLYQTNNIIYIKHKNKEIEFKKSHK